MSSSKIMVAVSSGHQLKAGQAQQSAPHCLDPGEWELETPFC